MLIKRTILFPLALSLAFNLKSQTPQNLGAPINSQLISEYSPSLSGNGKTMIFQATSGEDNKPEVVISYNNSGVWSRPESLPNINASAGGKIPVPKDPILSYDGNYIYYSASKFGGIGGTDIWYMEKTGNVWSIPKNMAKPVNTIGQESDPSLSPDGKFLYFIRYTDKKSPTGQACGKIFVSEKTGNLWKEPKELPAPVSTGNECSPRILADNQTLIFSSLRNGGKGGLDLYRTQLDNNGSWSAPVPLTFINTDKDETYVSIPAKGDYLFHTGPSKTGTDLFKTKIPEELRSKKVISIEGIVKDIQTQQPISSRIVAYNTKMNKISGMTQTDASGKYLMYLTAGAKYDFSIIANNKVYQYYSEYIDLDTLTKFIEKKGDISLSILKKDISFKLANVAFEPNTDKILDRSGFELSRIQRLLQDNPNATVEIGVNTDIVTMDSIPSPKLTEVIIDSVDIQDQSDTTGTRKIKIARKTFHNNISQKQADAIVAALIKKGIPKERLIPKGYGDKNLLFPNDTDYHQALNRRIEIKIIKP